MGNPNQPSVSITYFSPDERKKLAAPDGTLPPSVVIYGTWGTALNFPSDMAKSDVEAIAAALQDAYICGRNDSMRDARKAYYGLLRSLGIH